MDLNEIFKEIKKKFSPRKSIDFEEEKLHFEVEPLNSIEEIVIMESLQDIDGVLYLEVLKRHTLACALKKINDDEIENDVKYMDENGKEKTKTHFLFMVNYTSQWPMALIDILFEGYSNMLRNVQQKLKDSAKFEGVEISEKVEEETSEKFRKIKEDSTSGLTDTERLNKKVKEEIDREEAHRYKKVEEEIDQKKTSMSQTDTIKS